jgi:hypothetical protein
MLVVVWKLLSDRDEGDPWTLDALREISERSRQAIDLVDDDDVDPAVSDRGEVLLSRA